MFLSYMTIYIQKCVQNVEARFNMVDKGVFVVDIGGKWVIVGNDAVCHENQ